VRVPERAMGDMRAQLASIRTGERRMLHLLKRYGNRAFKESIRRVYEQSERFARAAVEKIPDGVYEAESFMDDDGVNLGKHIPIKVRVEVAGDKMTIDLSNVSPQVAGFYNSGITAGRSAAELVFKCITAPLLLPINDGSFRPLKIILPPGRVVSAVKPAPVRVWMTVPMTVCDTIPLVRIARSRVTMPICAQSIHTASTPRLAGFFGRTSVIPAGDGAPSTMKTA
jgi:N-methylhydantoinase B